MIRNSIKLQLLLLVGLFQIGTVSGNTTRELNSFSVQFEIKTEYQSDSIPFIIGNKEWDSGHTTDLLSTSNMGMVRSTAKESGWSIFIQPNGAWGWNVGDGKYHLDYLPSAEVQKINDGRWHRVGMKYKASQRTIHLSYDGNLRAIYSLDELSIENIKLSAEVVQQTTNSKIKIRSIEKGNEDSFSDSFKEEWMKSSNATCLDKPEELTVITWNIWHGGRHNGKEQGVQQAIDALKKSEAQLVCMQETYGSGPVIADALGKLFYYRSSNLSVHSSYPIVDTHQLYDPFRLGGVRVKMGKQLVDVFSLWIHYLPDIESLYEENKSIEYILNEENKTRGNEIRDIIARIKESGKNIGTGKIPLLIAGDFNSLSHLDWDEETKNIHNGYVIPWPVSIAMEEFGMTDSYRSLCKYTNVMPGITWSPRFRQALPQRIDYIYTKGELNCIDSYVLGYNDRFWPSDHAAVVSKFHWGTKK